MVNILLNGFQQKKSVVSGRIFRDNIRIRRRFGYFLNDIFGRSIIGFVGIRGSDPLLETIQQLVHTDDFRRGNRGWIRHRNRFGKFRLHHFKRRWIQRRRIQHRRSSVPRIVKKKAFHVFIH